MKRSDFIHAAQITYGDPGLNAAESTDISAADLALGYEHCLTLILPALEEELMAEGSLFT